MLHLLKFNISRVEYIFTEVGMWSPRRHMWRKKQNICNVA